ncbi:MAG: hypothetical protein V3S41_08410 [Spirochaetia bacterium]
MNRALQRSGLPLLVFAAAVLVAAGIVVVVGSPLTEGLLRGRGVPATTGDATGADVQADDTAPEPPTPELAPSDEATRPEGLASPAPPAAIAETHTVVQGDTLFGLAGEYWSDPYLWPVLLVANSDTVTDPDYLRWGSVLNIPRRPDAPAVADAHIAAYHRYRELGGEALSQGRAQGDLWLIQLGLIRVNKAYWVLYSGLRYDDGLLERAGETVPRVDLEIVRGFVNRFGRRPGT